MAPFNWIVNFLHRDSLQNRKARHNRKSRRARGLCVQPLESRLAFAVGVASLDGAGNNLAHPDWGSVNSDLIRMAVADYGDGVSTPAGEDRPSARAVSNALVAQPEDAAKNDRSMSNFIYAWGQFIDHDLDLTTAASPAEAFNISVPSGDPQFDPTGTGEQVIPLSRSVYNPATGDEAGDPRQQLNTVTAWIDGSMVYGSDAATAASLRTFSGGRLKTSDGDLLPLNEDDSSFLAGDVRVNENVELTSLHVLFMREHNRVADAIASAHPELSDEAVFQQARRWVVGEIQAITFNEFLPALLGLQAPTRYAGYNPQVNPGIANEFSTAAFRVGHTMVGDDVEFLDNEGNEIREAIPLSEAFFNPDVVRETGIDPILKYLASDLAEEVDTHIVESLRNFLFGPPGAGGLDLASLNVQRGRDHGLADYNTTRAAYGLPRVQSFAEITSDVDVQQALESTYGSVDNIDLWVGGLAENHMPGASIGPTFGRIIADQFQRLRDGDRFWYQRAFSGHQRRELEHTTLADVIQRNTQLTSLQKNVFFFRDSVPDAPKPGHPFATFVDAVYADVLRRGADPAGLAFWLGELDRGTPRDGIVRQLSQSREYFAERIVTPCYQRYLGRLPDSNGLEYWVDRLQQQGLRTEEFEARMVGSPESYLNSNASNAAWVNALYETFLRRPADEGGRTAWVGRLDAGATRDEIAHAFASSAEREGQRIAEIYLDYLGRAPDPQGLKYWESRVAQGATQENLIASLVASDEYFSGLAT